jgi:hypothetical protein
MNVPIHLAPKRALRPLIHSYAPAEFRPASGLGWFDDASDMWRVRERVRDGRELSSRPRSLSVNSIRYGRTLNSNTTSKTYIYPQAEVSGLMPKTDRRAQAL